MMMRIFARFNEVGDPLGYYSDLIHGDPADEGSKVPPDAVEITQEQHQDLVNNQGRRRYIDGEVVHYDPPPPAIDLTAYAADTRWRKETGGIIVAGVPVATDDRSKQMIIGARIAADADPDWTTMWVGANDSIYAIDAVTIVAISDAVQAHVNACFALYADVKTDIDTGTITTTQEIDAAFGI